MTIKTKILNWVFHKICSRKRVRRHLIDEIARYHYEEIIERYGKELLEQIFPDKSDITRYSMQATITVLPKLIEKYNQKILNLQLSDALRILFAYIRESRLDTPHNMINTKIKLQIGSGGITYAGWLNTDINQLDMTKEEDWANLFLPGSISNILAEHVLEHLSFKDLKIIFFHIYKYLAPGGVMRIAVPDAFHPSRYYYNLVKPGGEETPYEHKLFFDYSIVKKLIDPTLFDLKLIEYFDENGTFHAQDYELCYGEIVRCARNNVGINLENKVIYEQFYSSIPEHLREQFIIKNITYTSLFFDITKLPIQETLSIRYDDQPDEH